MSRFIEYITWAARLWLVDFGQRVYGRETQLMLKDPRGHDTRFGRFVDRLSPFSTTDGYHRVWLRRLLYTVRYPLVALRFESLRMVQSIVYRLVPRTYPGRYETYPPSTALKSEWFDSHSEWASETTGDSDTFLWVAVFIDFTPPWTRGPGDYAIAVDSHGFVGYFEGTDAPEVFAEADARYDYDPENMDIEGDPSLNGAFGGTQVAQ